VTADRDSAVCVGAEHCITCGDEGIPMRVLAVSEMTALCADGAADRHEVAVDLIGPVSPGDAILVHAGVAIRMLSDDKEAA